MKKVKFIALILVLTLGLVGGAYASWTDALHVEGTVATGDIDVVFTDAVSNDPGETFDPACPEGDAKHVGATEVFLSDNGKTMTVTIDNAYPGYVSEIEYKVTNNGSVPVKLQSKEFNVVSGDPAGLEIDNGKHGRCPNCGNKWKHCNCGHEQPSPLPGELAIGTQIHQGDTFTGTIFHEVTDDAAQNAEYTYTIDYNFVQFNKFE